MKTRESLHAEIISFVRASSRGERNDEKRDALLTSLLAWQESRIPALAKIRSVRAALTKSGPDAFAALPTDLYREMRIASFDEGKATRVFRTSGTTQGRRGAHEFLELSLYDAAAECAARYALFPDVDRMQLVVLAPSAAELSDSSLSYMLDRFHGWFGTPHDVVAVRDAAIDAPLLRATFRDAESADRPIALLGTSFAFVHAEDAFQDEVFRLPAGSRIMQTGGFKGRSREIEPSDMRRLLSKRYGVDEAMIVAEYGMTELSSQMYENTLRARVIDSMARERTLWVPPWVRVTAVHPETCARVPHGEIGILRIDDLANLDSCAAVQTSDVGREVEGGIVLLGRDPKAVPRGCSLAMDVALSREANHA